MKKYIPLIGRICFSLIFIYSGIQKMMDFDGTWKLMAQNDLPMAPLLLIAAIFFEFGGGLFLLFGFQTKVGALLLLLFIVPTTIVFHHELGTPEQQATLLRNLAIIGGLFTFLYHGGGPVSLDANKDWEG